MNISSGYRISSEEVALLAMYALCIDCFSQN